MNHQKYLELARKEALKSKCIRRKYGAVITNESKIVAKCNERVSSVCSEICVREGTGHGKCTEKGAEVHAEQAALISWGPKNSSGTHLYIAGIGKDGSPLYGKEAYPCYACAKMIKYAGFSYVYLETGPGSIDYVNIADILLDWEIDHLAEVGIEYEYRP